MVTNRTVVEDIISGVPTFRNELLAIEPDEQKADQLIENAALVLSRDPTLGIQFSPHSPLWYYEIMTPICCLLYYTFDASEVLFVSIQKR
ncbi:MAG: hypothetical protein ACREQ4_10395 [Candidatus Binataceae bacterium]